MLLKFERAVDKNQDQRSKYPDDPTKYAAFLVLYLFAPTLYLHTNLTRFIDSEADLDSAIKSLLPLAQEPVLAYSELIKSGVVLKLIGLLSHENADIMIDVVQLIHELVDEDAGAENEDEDEDGEKREGAIKMLVDAFVSIIDSLLRKRKELTILSAREFDPRVISRQPNKTQ